MKLEKAIENMSLSEMFKIVMEQYNEVLSTPYSQENELFIQWKNVKTKIIEKIIANSGLDFKKEYVSDLNKDGRAKIDGAGAWSKVFCVSIRAKEVESLQQGIYITYLFNVEKSHAYLTLSQAAKEYDNQKQKIKEVVDDIRNKLKISGSLVEDVDTGNKTYDAGVVASIKYTSDNIPNDDQLFKDLNSFAEIYKEYLKIERDVAGSSTNYTDQHLCEILKNMLKEAGTIGGRKNAAIALFGIIYGEFINGENKAKLLDVTAQFGGRRSNENQLNNGLCVYRFLKNNPAINIFDVLEKTSVSVNELSQQLENELKSAERRTKEARVIIFGIKNSKNIPESNSERQKIYGDGGLIALGCHIVDFIEAFPQYKTLKPNSFQEDEKNMNQNINLNTILYGPPGTGKTYNTVLYAVAICDGNTSLDDLKEEAKSKDGYNKIIDRYNELIDQGRIAFTTFHQSYGYEEFVEGIKPEMDEKKQLYYNVKAGCFKDFCDNASIKLVDKDSTISSNITVWKTTIQKSVIKDCFENNRVRIGWDIEDVGANGFVNDMKTGDLILTTDGSRTKINGIAIIKSEAYTLEGESDTTTRDVDWISTDINLDISEFNNGKMLHRMTVARVPNVDAIKILSISEKFSTLNVEKNKDPYVFIIDEINRGNVSKIFGELITLIEDSKRSGRKEAMEVVLPYSGDRFSVPENVYILGTMNTADRSLALMDTALRRRFDFVEMMPDTRIFEGIEVDGISIKSLLEKINKRIEFLYDREHTIGHAYFKELLDKENRNIETLRKIFIKKIIPLLQEYFYDDYERIRLVLGDNRADINDECFIQECDDMDKLFFGNADIDRESKTYLVNKDIKEFSTERFKKIYE